MITITCHNDNVPERKYAINLVFNTLLEIDIDLYQIIFDDTADSYIIKSADQQIIIEDHFFKSHPDPLSYLKRENIPSKLSYLHAFDFVIPIIYGIDKFINEEKRIVVGLDIFASTFFMLTRWEESILGREENGDCDESLLFTVKNDVSQRAIVHEYEELLRHIFSLCGLTIEKKRKYHVVLSHDVDAIISPSFSELFKCLYRKKPFYTLVYNNTLSRRDVIRYKLAFPNSFSQTNKYCSLARKYDCDEWFYIKATAKGEKGNTYDYRDKKTVQYIKKLIKNKDERIGIGLHPSQFTFNNNAQWEKEAERLKTLTHEKIRIGRNHHLLYNYNTLRNWESLNDTTSSSFEISNFVFHKRLGFRCGISIPFQVYDIFQRRPMNLIECPCTIMDTCMIQGCYDQSEERWKNITEIIDLVKKYRGELVLTWHILIRELNLFDEYYQLCDKVLSYSKKTDNIC